MIELDLEESVNNILDCIPDALLKSDDEKETREQEKGMLSGTYFVRTFMMFSATLDQKI